MMESILFFLVIFLILVVNLSLLFMGLGIFFGAHFGAPFVPTNTRTVNKMVELAKIKPGMTIIDLGCGDGRLVFTAAEKGATAYGVEISPPVFLLAKLRQWIGRHQTSKILFGNFFKKKEVLESDVIFSFLLAPLMDRIFEEIWPKLKPGTRLISHAFAPKNGVKPVAIYPKCEEHGKVLVFVKG